MIFDNVWNGLRRKRTVAKRSARSRLAQTITVDERKPWKVTPEIERLRSAPLLSPVIVPWGRAKAAPKRGRRFATERDRRNQRLSTRASRRRRDRARSFEA